MCNKYKAYLDEIDKKITCCLVSCMIEGFKRDIVAEEVANIILSYLRNNFGYSEIQQRAVYKAAQLALDVLDGKI